MRADSLTAQVAETLLQRIIRGELPMGQELPPEAVLAEELDVSRLTLREALKTLQSQGVVRAVHGRRGMVNPVAQWTSLDPVVRETEHRLGSSQASLQLLEMRRLIEVGAAGLAADRRTREHCDELASLLTTLERSQQANDVAAFVEADIAFHDVIFQATGNEFIRLVYEPFHALLLGRRRETSSVPRVQVNANKCHVRIAEAIMAGDPDAARDAMSEHMDQTLRDLRNLLALS